MVEFCPECGNMLRKKACRCGYTQYETTTTKIPLLQLWNPPPPNIIFCKLTATPYETLKSMLKKGSYPAKLKEVRKMESFSIEKEDFCNSRNNIHFPIC